jgi:hypothetical protein
MRSEDTFYSSKEWQEGPRDRVLVAIETYSTVVVSVGTDTLRAMRHLMAEDTAQADKKGSAMEHSTLATTASDATTLLALNEDYIRSVEVQTYSRSAKCWRTILCARCPTGH